VDVPVRLHPEPSLLRVRDRDTAQCTVFVDNSNSNRPVPLRFAGSDPELAVGFRFEPGVLEVAPAATGSVLVSVTAAEPEPGQEISRPLTITALDGNRRVDTGITFQQVASASPMSTLADEGYSVKVIDNRSSAQPVRVAMRGDDPENVGSIRRAGDDHRGVSPVAGGQ
jgi:hypothetical protein